METHPRKILVLYVGGTIGMKKNANGALEPCPHYLTTEMQNMQELRRPSSSSVVPSGKHTHIAPFTVIEYETLLDSSDMNHEDHLRIAKDIEQHYNDYDGFLVAHGTDTMHYTASALSFLFYNLAKPVIVTGAMVPLAEPFNDARRNLIISMMIASNPFICEVCVFFNDSLFRGNRCNKVRHDFAAFESVNYPPLGKMEGSEFVLQERLLLPQPSGGMSILSRLDGKVVVVPVAPDASRQPQVLVPLITSGEVEGIVLIVTGIGKIKGGLARVLRAAGNAAREHGVVVVLATQDLQGKLRPSEVARLAAAVGDDIIYAADMSPSTAEVKLSYLLGKRRRHEDTKNQLNYEQIKQMMVSNLRGEITPDAPNTSILLGSKI